MAKHLRYYGEFASVEGHVNRVAIYQESDTPFTPEEVRFPADSPVVIEWAEKSKEEVICGSSCTVKLISARDRQFLDFFQVKYGDCRLDVYRDGNFYWTGCLDTEFYEEPYEKLNNYEVTLTFSDFAVLDRLPFNNKWNVIKVSTLLLLMISKTKCIRFELDSDFDESFEYSKSGISMPAWDEFLVGTKAFSKSVLEAYVRVDNFIDENGERMKWSEVVEETLRPLSIKLVQRNGFICIYDYDTLFKSNDDKEIYWTSDSQNLSFDRVYNNIKITWSPYAQVNNMLPETCWPSSIETPASTDALNLLDGKTVGDATCYSYPLRPAELEDRVDSNAIGFDLWTTDNVENITLHNGEVFKITPVYDGSDAEGVFVYYKSVKYVSVPWLIPGRFLNGYETKGHGRNPFLAVDGPYVVPSAKLFTTSKILIPPKSDGIQLRLTMESLVDCKLNPFEDPRGVIQGTTYKKISSAMSRFNAHANIMYIPVRLCFQAEGSSDVYYYSNDYCVFQSDPITAYGETQGVWRKNNPDSICFLAYYLPETKDRRESSALCKWTTNRQAINPHNEELTTQMKKMDDGEYIPYPTAGSFRQSGELWVEVAYNSWIVCNGGDTLMNAEHVKQTNLVAQDVTFCAVKLPKIEIIKNDILSPELSTSDIEYNAEVNPDAREGLDIDTKLGTYLDSIPTARGCYWSEYGVPVREFRRGGHTGKIEELLAGTLFSQYNDRHVVLSGECRIDEDRKLSYVEANQEGKKFVCVSESQDLIRDTSDAKFIEYTQDEFEKL